MPNGPNGHKEGTLTVGNESQDAIISRLDQLITAVNRLAEAMEAKGVAAPAAPQPAASVPTRSHSAPSAAPPEPKTAASAPAVATGADLADGAETIEVLVDEQLVTGVPGASASFSALLTRMFQAALHEDAETAWLELTALTHPKELFAPRALDSLKAFSWKQMRKNAGAYLNQGTAASFSIARTDPAELKGDEQRMKVFLNASGRSPAPVTLIRDNDAGGAWRLGQVSL